MVVSVIIPALNEADNIGACIQAARDAGEGAAYTPSQMEVIVADGGSTDGTPDRIPEGARLVRAPRGRGVQMNRGAAASSGDILVFCHADTQLPAGWREAVLAAVAQPGVSGGAFQIAYLPARGFLHVMNRHWLRPSQWWAVHGDRAQFMTRDTFSDVGGFAEIALMEDVEMARALHDRGRIALIPKRVIASSRRFLERGPLFQYLLSLWCLTRYLRFGASPEEIARIYRSSREVNIARKVRQPQQTEERNYG